MTKMETNFKKWLILLCFIQLMACTKKNFQVNDCVQDSEDGDVFRIMQIVDQSMYGYKYINSELGNETVELDQTVSYKKVVCPDTKKPSPAE